MSFHTSQISHKKKTSPKAWESKIINQPEIQLAVTKYNYLKNLDKNNNFKRVFKSLSRPVNIYSRMNKNTSSDLTWLYNFPSQCWSKTYNAIHSMRSSHSRKQILQLIIYVEEICMTTLEQVADLANWKKYFFTVWIQH